MFNPTTQTKLDAAYKTTLASLCQTEMTWTEAAPPQSTGKTMGHFKWAGADEQNIINAFGENTGIITIPVGHLPQKPRKFDRIDCVHGVFIIQSVEEVVFSNAVSWYRCAVKGK